MSKVATAVIAGLGAEGYRAATASLLKLIKQKGGAVSTSD